MKKSKSKSINKIDSKLNLTRPFKMRIQPKKGMINRKYRYSLTYSRQNKNTGTVTYVEPPKNTSENDKKNNSN